MLRLLHGDDEGWLHVLRHDEQHADLLRDLLIYRIELMV